MIADDFIFNGKRLSDFGFIMAAPESDDTFGLSRELLKGSINPHRPEANHYGTQYSDTAILNFYVIDIDSDDEDTRITMPTIRGFQAWITATSVPSPLILEFDYGDSLIYNGVFTEVEPHIFNGLNGFNLVFTCNSPFAYKPQRKEFSGSGTLSIDCDSDENMYVFPKLTFSNISSGEYSIINETDSGSEMRITLDSAYTEYILDCKLKRILADSEVLTLTDVGWNTENITDYNNVNTGIYKAYWLRFLPGINELTITGNADCLIEYLIPMKAGGFIDV